MGKKAKTKKNPVALGMAALSAVPAALEIIKMAKKAAPRSQKPPKLSSYDAPAAKGYRTVSKRAVTSMVPGGVRIRNRELISGSVAGSTSWILQLALSLNPGLAATFPWLAPQAQQYQEYYFNRVGLIFVPILSTGAQGDVILSPDYNAADLPPASEVQAVDHVGSVIDSCWKTSELWLNKRDMHALSDKKFVRPCAVAGDIKTFDVGKIYFSTNNEATNGTIGKLFIDYDVVLLTPVNGPLNFTLPNQTSMFTQTSTNTYTTTVAALQTFATAVYDPLSIGITNAGAFTPPAGVYRVALNITCEDTLPEAFEVIVTFNKNGSANSSRKAIGQIDNVAGNQYITLSVNDIIPCNGTDTVSVAVVMSGAAGVLTVPASGATLVWSLA